MKRGLFITIIIGLALTSCMSDLRTTAIKEGKLDEQKGRELLTKVGKAHFIENWKNINTYSVVFQDEFFGINKVISPYKENPTKMQLDYIPASFNGRICFLEGKQKNEIWGMQDWKTYTKENEFSETVFKKDKNIKFWIPTYQYFIEFPALIQDAQVVSYAGEDTFEGKQYHLVMASWKTLNPQKNIDQYLIWINKETHRIEIVQFTIRDSYNFVKGSVYFKEFRELNGVLVPFQMPIQPDPGKSQIHEMRIQDFKVNVVDKKELLPASSETAITTQ